MNRVSVLVFSLAIVVLSAFSTAYAQDLKASWLEYQNGRQQLNDSYKQIDSLWTQLYEYASEWETIQGANYAQAVNSWDLIESSWAQVDSARIIVANTLKIHLSDSSVRGSRPAAISIYTPARTSAKPWTPEPTWGSWEELNAAWASLDQAWSLSSSAWTELDQAWITISRTTSAIANYSFSADDEWAKINAAWAEIDAAWASKR